MSLAHTYLGLFRRNPALSRLLAGEFISGIGDWLYLVAILVVVYAESQSAVLLGVIGAARILPYVLLSVPAGIVADRFDRRMVLLVTDVARGAIMLLLAACVALEAPTLALVALSILAACFSTFFGPAIGSLIPTLVDEHDLGPANSAWATLDNVAFIIGPAMAGLLIAGGGLVFAFLLNAVSFAVVAVILWRMEVPKNAPEEMGSPAVGDAPGVRWRQLARPLVGPFILDSATSLVSGAISVLTVLMALDVLSAGEAGTGYLNAATGVGGVVAGVAGGALLARRLEVPLLIGGVLGGAGLAWLAVSGDLLVAMLAIGVAVAGVLLLDIVNTTLIQRIVPDELRGRAMGGLQTSSAILYSLGSLFGPILADLTGMTAVLLGAAALTALGVAAALALGRAPDSVRDVEPARLRAMDRPIFAGLPPARLETAARRLTPVRVAAGQQVVGQGDEADRFFIVDAGSFSVSREDGGTTTALRELGPGDVFGEIGLLRGIPRTATVTAVTDGVLHALDANDFTDLVSSGPGLGSRLLDLYRGALAR